MASTQVGDAGASWSVGSLIGTSFSVLSRHFMAFIGIALIGYLPSLVISFAMTPSPRQLSAIGAAFWEAQALGLVGTLFALFAWIMMFYGATQALYGRPVSIAECASKGIGRLGVVVGAVILAYLGIGVASLLLVVPGIMLSLRWIVVVPVATVEGTGVFASLTRSAELTKGRRWRIFGATLVYSLIAMLPLAVIFLVVGAASGGMMKFMTITMQSLTFRIVSLLIYAAYSTFGACFFATLYYFLRREKDGVDATVFD